MICDLESIESEITSDYQGGIADFFAYLIATIRPADDYLFLERI